MRPSGLSYAVVAMTIAACASPAPVARRVEPGLTNAQSIQQPNPARDPTEPFDAVSNGQRSCGNNGQYSDPLRYRWPPCAEQTVQQSGAPAALPDAGPPPPGR